MAMVADILLVHAAATWFMVGLIWMVQVVHYPLFARVGEGGYAEYQRSHMGRISWIVAPGMFVELGSAGALAWLVGSALSWVGLGLLVMIWVSTFAVQVPLHGRLAHGFDERAHRRLVLSNWARTLLWTARGVVSLLMIAPVLE